MMQIGYWTLTKIVNGRSRGWGAGLGGIKGCCYNATEIFTDTIRSLG